MDNKADISLKTSNITVPHGVWTLVDLSLTTSSGTMTILYGGQCYFIASTVVPVDGNIDGAVLFTSAAPPADYSLVAGQFLYLMGRSVECKVLITPTANPIVQATISGGTIDAVTSITNPINIGGGTITNITNPIGISGGTLSSVGTVSALGAITNPVPLGDLPNITNPVPLQALPAIIAPVKILSENEVALTDRTLWQGQNTQPTPSPLLPATPYVLDYVITAEGLDIIVDVSTNLILDAADAALDAVLVQSFIYANDQFTVDSSVDISDQFVNNNINDASNRDFSVAVNPIYGTSPTTPSAQLSNGSVGSFQGLFSSGTPDAVNRFYIIQGTQVVIRIVINQDTGTPSGTTNFNLVVREILPA